MLSVSIPYIGKIWRYLIHQKEKKKASSYSISQAEATSAASWIDGLILSGPRHAARRRFQQVWNDCTTVRARWKCLGRMLTGLLAKSVCAIDVDRSFLPVSSTSAKFPHRTWSMKDFGGWRLASLRRKRRPARLQMHLLYILLRSWTGVLAVSV